MDILMMSLNVLTFFVDLFSSIPYILLVLILVPTIGFLLIDKVMTSGINMRAALFEQDNPVAGFEFGGQILLLIYAGFCAIMGPTVGSFGTDFLVAGGWIIGSMVTITVVRGILGYMVKTHNGGNDLNHEIFVQRNWAAGCYSLALTIGIVSGLTEEDMFGSAPLRDLAIAATVLGFGLSVGWLFRITHLHGRSAFHAMFTEDNSAAGVSLLGFAVAANIIFAKAADLVRLMENGIGMTIGCVIFYSFFLLALMSLLRTGMEYGLRLTLKVDITDETFAQKNVGAGFIDASVTIGVALLLTGAIS
ncbi:MAG: hypothetical protein UU48_C0004G0021 [Candidatus Uhrbacteria bacterium GW2011_GWF2_41_16]|uniref:DUF350 domain-containing protein n=1 Tax=Candidatus Uhrbacteria bacterium GW2011_GWF2_41_16 TaxID=1618997 RepID=A0A0G0VBD4_9BACT|nr:MAG: hypothetical protein UU48_C0004G0021 [Candidatus Uhrbacteria bacterium GW2011_GWF2_41_16]HBP00012.1 hypothetical protein [Candidatus Uhrbacteria bacterium]